MNAKYEAIKAQLESLSEEVLVALHNDYCEAHNNYDDRVEHMDNFDEFYCDTRPYNIALRIHYGNFNPMHKYFYFNGYGNLVSFTSVKYDDTPIDISALCDFIAEGYTGGDYTELAECIDDNELAEAFIEAYFPGEDLTYALEKIERICKEETFDLVTEDWGDLAETYRTFKGE